MQEDAPKKKAAPKEPKEKAVSALHPSAPACPAMYSLWLLGMSSVLCALLQPAKEKKPKKEKKEKDPNAPKRPLSEYKGLIACRMSQVLLVFVVRALGLPLLCRSVKIGVCALQALTCTSARTSGQPSRRSTQSKWRRCVPYSNMPRCHRC